MSLINITVNGRTFLAKEGDQLTWAEIVQCAYPLPDVSVSYAFKHDPNDFFKLSTGGVLKLTHGLDITVTPKES